MYHNMYFNTRISKQHEKNLTIDHEYIYLKQHQLTSNHY